MVTTITNSGLANSSTIEPKETTVVVSGFGTGRTKDSKDKFTANGINNLKIVESTNKIKQNGFSSFKVVPAIVTGSFDERFNEAFDGVSSTVTDALASVQQDANNIKNTVLNMSNNLTTNYLSKAELTSYDNIINITSAIKEQTATFVTAEQAGGWYGLTLESDVNGKKYITGFDIGSIVYPESGINDSYFRINADRFIVGGDIGDGKFGGPLDENGEPIPAFSIVQDGSGSPQMYFNGKVNIASIPEAVTKLIGKFAHISELNSYLAMHPEVVVRDGDSYLNTSENIVYFWDGDEWISAQAKIEFKSIVFKRSASRPSTPTDGNYSYPIPTGWEDGIPAVDPSKDAQDPVWWTVTTFDNKTDYTGGTLWGEPVIASDTETQDLMYNSSQTEPATPTYTGDLTAVSASDASAGWYNNPTTTTKWAAIRVKSEGVWTAWGVYQVRGEDGSNGRNGTDGQNGATGSRGSAILHGSGSGSFSASTASSAFINKFGYLVNGDQYIWTSTNYGTVIRTYNGSIWTDNTALTVHGDAVIDGTLYASKIATVGINSVIVGTNTVSSRGSFSLGEQSVFGYPSVIVGAGSGSNSGIAGYSAGLNGVVGHTASSSNSGVFGVSSSGVGGGLGHSSYGLFTVSDVFVGGTVYSFTGSHIAYTQESVSIGDIAATTDAWAINVNQSLVHTYTTVTEKDNNVFGVINSQLASIGTAFENSLYSTFVDGAWVIKDEYKYYLDYMADNGYTQIGANSLGEGGINVCASNGDILKGDYITSSTVAGKGMKQDDDLLHNYTVAKALENVIWDDEVAGEGGCFEQDGYKCKMIACTYHSG